MSVRSSLWLLSSYVSGFSPYSTHKDANDQYAGLLANECLYVLNSSLAWPRTDMLTLVHQSLGILPQPNCSGVPFDVLCNTTMADSWWISTKVVTMLKIKTEDGGSGEQQTRLLMSHRLLLKSLSTTLSILLF